jgi:hypothetical protein
MGWRQDAAKPAEHAGSSMGFDVGRETPRPPFRTVQTREQHQNRAGPHDSHREYQCDRFLRAHEAILGTGVVFRGRSSSHSVRHVRSRSIVNSE